MTGVRHGIVRDRSSAIESLTDALEYVAELRRAPHLTHEDHRAAVEIRQRVAAVKRWLVRQERRELEDRRAQRVFASVRVRAPEAVT